MTEVFWTFFITSLIGLTIASIKLCYKSKCKEIHFCCMKIVRDTEAEKKETEFLSTHPISNTNNDDNI